MMSDKIMDSFSYSPVPVNSTVPDLPGRPIGMIDIIRCFGDMLLYFLEPNVGGLEKFLR